MRALDSKKRAYGVPPTERQRIYVNFSQCGFDDSAICIRSSGATEMQWFVAVVSATPHLVPNAKIYATRALHSSQNQTIFRPKENRSKMNHTTNFK